MTTPIQTRYIGDDWDIAVNVTDVNNAAIDLTGYTPTGSLFQDGNNGSVAECTLGNSMVTVLNAAQGHLLFSIPKIITANVPPQSSEDISGIWFPTRLQVKLTDPLSKTRTVDLIRILPLSARTTV